MELGTKENPYHHSATVAVRDVLHAGRYYLGADRGLGVSVERRPSWLQRYLMDRLLGIHWKDEPHDVRVLGGQ